MLDINIESFKYEKTEETPILQDVSFSLEKGEHLAILGGSGCGKSTLLHLVYGLFHLKNGEIHYNNTKLLGPTHNLIPGEPFMKLVAQELNIMPFISVAENIASHLDRNDKEKDDARVDELLAVVHLTAYKHTKVKNLSGGQKQRVSIAKALAQQPEVLLLDEPFSSIDTFLKNTLRRSFFNYTRSQNITCIIATHDSEEALSFSDRILLCVMEK
ncbi:multiple sugar-binding ABC transporter, ATP-binding protein [unidentified eubacterium SCB49]|nr:multiple sugar-binding ABC transporter, ATP-binding protein [unidentified eubacterium SCB49]